MNQISQRPRPIDVAVFTIWFYRYRSTDHLQCHCLQRARAPCCEWLSISILFGDMARSLHSLATCLLYREGSEPCWLVEGGHSVVSPSNCRATSLPSIRFAFETLSTLCLQKRNSLTSERIHLVPNEKPTAETPITHAFHLFSRDAPTVSAPADTGENGDRDADTPPGIEL